MFATHPMRRRGAAAAVALLLVLVLSCFDVHAALYFRGVQEINNQQRLSAIRKYSNPSDVAYARISASGAPLPAEEVRVFLAGEITSEDVSSAAVMAGLLRSGKQKIAGNTVWLASNGGDIDAAMDIGRLLRKLGVFTVIDQKDQCLSACVFAFMGGERRSVAGRLGIHRPFLPVRLDTPDRQARFRYLQKTLRNFIEELDFPPSLYEAVMMVPPESMHILAAAELKRFYLDGISPSSEDAEDAAAAGRLGLSMPNYLQRKAKAPVCSFVVFGQGGSDGKAQQ